MRHIIDAENASPYQFINHENGKRPAPTVLNVKHDIIDADALQMSYETCLGRLM